MPTPPRPAARDLAPRFPSVTERCYTHGKLSTDPLYPAVLDALHDRSLPLLDIGCGMGVLAFYLRLAGWMQPVRGMDYDPRKIATANSLAPGFPGSFHFTCEDATQGLPEHSGDVTILDILQYFPSNQRDELLKVAADRVAPGGVLVIRTGMADRSLRFWITRAIDYVAALLRWMKSPPLHYPTREDLESCLESAGLTGSFKPLWGKTPFNNWLGVFHRPV